MLFIVNSNFATVFLYLINLNTFGSSYWLNRFQLFSYHLTELDISKMWAYRLLAKYWLRRNISIGISSQYVQSNK